MSSMFVSASIHRVRLHRPYSWHVARCGRRDTNPARPGICSHIPSCSVFTLVLFIRDWKKNTCMIACNTKPLREGETWDFYTIEWRVFLVILHSTAKITKEVCHMYLSIYTDIFFSYVFLCLHVYILHMSGVLKS